MQNHIWYASTIQKPVKTWSPAEFSEEGRYRLGSVSDPENARFQKKIVESVSKKSLQKWKNYQDEVKNKGSLRKRQLMLPQEDVDEKLRTFPKKIECDEYPEQESSTQSGKKMDNRNYPAEHKWMKADKDGPPPDNESEADRKKRLLKEKKLRVPLNRSMKALQARQQGITTESDLANFFPNRGLKNNWRDVFEAVNSAYEERFPESINDSDLLGETMLSEFSVSRDLAEYPVQDPADVLPQEDVDEKLRTFPKKIESDEYLEQGSSSQSGKTAVDHNLNQNCTSSGGPKEIQMTGVSESMSSAPAQIFASSDANQKPREPEIVIMSEQPAKKATQSEEQAPEAEEIIKEVVDDEIRDDASHTSKIDLVSSESEGEETEDPGKSGVREAPGEDISAEKASESKNSIPEECILNKYGHCIAPSICPFAHNGIVQNRKRKLPMSTSWQLKLPDVSICSGYLNLQCWDHNCNHRHIIYPSDTV